MGERGQLSSGFYIIFSMEKGMKIINGGQVFCTPKIVSAVKTVQFVSDRLSYIVPRVCWCNIIVLNVHVTSEEKNDDSNGKFFRFSVIFLSTI